MILSDRQQNTCIHVHDLCNEGDLEVPRGTRTETTLSEPYKSMSMMGIRRDHPPLEFWPMS